jgi:hypothetical protein
MSAQTMRERLARIRAIVRESGEPAEVKLMLLERIAGRYMELNALDDMLASLEEMRELARGLNAPDQHASIACGFANAYTVLGPLRRRRARAGGGSHRAGARAGTLSLCPQ